MTKKLMQLLFRSGSKKDYFNSIVNEWPVVDHALEDVFLRGGNLSLKTLLEAKETKYGNAYYSFDLVSIRALPGKYTLSIFPTPSKKPARIECREWVNLDFTSEPGQTIFDEDHIYDNKLVCDDLKVALEICAEFFFAREITARMKELTVSVWDNG